MQKSINLVPYGHQIIQFNEKFVLEFTLSHVVDKNVYRNNLGWNRDD